MRAPRAVAAIAVVVLAGCSAASPESAPTPPPSPSSPTPSPTASPSPPPPTPPPTPSPPPPVFSTSAAAEAVQALAGDIGPREATSASFTAAADYVQARLTELGYEVARPAFSVPAGESWGVPVPAGETANVVATAPGTSLDEPFLVVGAHLDTVPVAPGAVDNASGIAVLLEVARMATLDAPPVPLVLVAFGAEEPRGPGDDLHHFGSQAFVRGLSPAQRAALVGAVAIDSVGISPDVPICTAVAGADPFTQAVREAARSAGVPVRECENRTSDHWSFVRSGLPGVRVGLAGTQEYAEYHSAADVPAVVDLDRLRRAGEAVWAAVSAGAAGTAG